MTDFYHPVQQHYRVEPQRYARAKEILAGAAVAITELDADHARAVVNGHYAVSIDLSQSAGGRAGCAACDCPDFVRGQHQNRACKHILALALEAGRRTGSEPSQAPPDPVAASQPSLVDAVGDDFRSRVTDAIGKAVEKLADRVHTALQAGEIPFLIGPTGCGKTSAVRRLAVRHGWAFEEAVGSQSWADADLVGLRTDHMELPGVFARAFQRARNGDQVLLLLDELLRFNQRAQDLLMRPLQETPAAVARAMGLPATQPVRLVEAPLWGLEWAEADRVHIVLAANPWGSAIDPALMRRVLPVQVDLDDAVAGLFESRLADAITASWSAVRSGELPLPVEYQGLATAAGPDDTGILVRYLLRLDVLDRAAADGFRTVLQGIGLQV